MNAAELEKLRYEESRAWKEFYALAQKETQAWNRFYSLSKRLRAEEARARGAERIEAQG